MMRKLIFGIIALLVVSCNEEPEVAFSLSGTATGFENGDLIFLDNSDKSIDSTEVKDNSFEFKTRLVKTPIQLWIHNKEYSNYRAFWAENKPMTFSAINTDFKNALLTGSETESLNYEHRQKLDSLPRTERKKLEIEFVNNNPNSIVSASILSVYATTWGREKTIELYEAFSAENIESEYGQKIAKYIELNKQPRIGDEFADFEMNDQNGNLRGLSELHGKTVLLEFWASWCGPCRRENPNLLKTYNKYNTKGFEIFAVSLDENSDSWLEAIKTDSLTWQQVSDLNGASNKAALIYGVSSIPDNFLIAENGKIVGRKLRGEELNKKLKEMLE